MDDKHAHTILARWHFLNQRLRRILLFAGGDANRTFEPRSCRALNVVVDLTAAAAIAADNVAVTTRAQIIEVLGRDHAAVTDKHNALKPKAFVEVVKDRRHGVGIAPVSGEHMMRDRPSVDQHQPNKHLRIARPTVTTVAVSAQDRGAFALEVGRGQIIKGDIDLERGQVAQAEIELMFDLWLAFEQLVERAVPLLQLARLHAHPRCLAGFARRAIAPCGDPASSLLVADKVGFQPAGKPMFAAWRDQPIGNQDKGSLTECYAVVPATPAELLEHARQAEFGPQAARNEYRSPVPSVERLNVFTAQIFARLNFPVQQSIEFVEIEMRSQQILAAEIDDCAMLILAVLAIGFDDAHVLVFDPLGAGGANHAQIHGPSIRCPGEPWSNI